MNTKWYHMVPKNADISKGIISPFWMADNNLEKLALNSVDKYRNRLVNSWNIYPGRNPNSLTLEEIMLGLNQFRGDNGTRAIYLFRYPPSSLMGPNMAKILKYKDIYEVDISKIPDIIDIEYNINNGPSKEWYDTVKPQEYFSSYDDNAEAHGKLLFAGIPHIAIITKQGRIHPKAIKKLTKFPLYHGSPNKYPILKRHIAQAYPEDNVVYATPLYEFALAYAGKNWTDLEINQSIYNGKHVLTEILPGEFDRIFNTQGYVHYISSDGFFPFSEEHNGIIKEWISIWDVTPYKIETISNVLKKMEQIGMTLYHYPNLPPFIKDRKRYIYDKCTKWNIDPTKYFSRII